MGWREKLYKTLVSPSESHEETSGSKRFRDTTQLINEASKTDKKAATKMALDAAKQRGVETLTAFSIPMLGTELVTYGPLAGTARLVVGSGASAVGSNVLGKAGDYIDEKAGTNFIGNAGRIVGGFGGYGLGIGATNPLLRSAAGKGITLYMPQETFSALRSAEFARVANSVKPTLPAQVKYYGPTMGKSYAAKTNPQLIDLDTWGRAEYDQLAKKYGYKDWREMILSDKGDYNAEYKQLIKDQIRRIQSDPRYNGQTIVVSNASLLKPNSGITFANTPTIPERSIMAIRNNSRHPWESIAHGESWWDSLQQKGTPLKIDNRFVSDIEGNKAIEFVPKTIDPQTAATTYHFDGRIPIKNRGGIIKGQDGVPEIDGGENGFKLFYNSLPQNQQDSTNFNIRRYWELNGQPVNFYDAFKRGMYTLQNDGLWHAWTGAWNQNGEYEFMKSPTHPTIKYELDWFNSDDAKDFRNNYQLDSTKTPWKYIPINKQIKKSEQ